MRRMERRKMRLTIVLRRMIRWICMLLCFFNSNLETRYYHMYALYNNVYLQAGAIPKVQCVNPSLA